MARNVAAGELRTLVYFRRILKGSDNKGYARQREEYVFVDSCGEEQPARPAIKTADEKAAEEATKAGEKVYNDYLDSRNL